MICIFEQCSLGSFEQPILNGELEDTVHDVPSSNWINSDCLEAPKLLAVVRITLFFEMYGAKILDARLLGAKLATHQTSMGMLGYSLPNLTRELDVIGFWRHDSIPSYCNGKQSALNRRLNQLDMQL